MANITTGIDAASVFDAAAIELSRGAIVGAFIVGASFLAGFAVFRRGAVSICALLMVAAAAALEFTWLGLFRAVPDNLVVLLQGVFAAATVVFLSSAIRAARNNALLGGIMFAGALSLVGVGVINFLDRVDAGGLMTWALGGVGLFALALSASQAVRGDAGARLILPGALLAVAAAVLTAFFGGSLGAGLAPHVLFTLGVLSASLVAFTEDGWRGAAATPLAVEPAAVMADDNYDHVNDAGALSDSQLAQVLDYSGVAVWDWSADEAYQTDSLPKLFGAESDSVFTPETMRALVHANDQARFENEVLGAGAPGDGGFDVTLKLHDGRCARLRGARAVDSGGALERIVAFAEIAAGEGEAHPLADKIAAALENGEVGVAFQPIVALNGEKIVGYEALARWRGADETATRPEDIVKAAESAGKGGALASAILDASAAFVAEKLETEKRRDIFVALNVSYGQVREKGFVAAVRKAVDAHDLRSGALVLELTEAEAITDPDAASQIFRLLKNAGVGLAFDDFGAGFSSLSNLHKFDFDYLKIDRSFIGELERGGDAVKIARAMTALGKDLGLKVIAEGVETRETAKAARDIGCAYGQGFAFGAPVQNAAAPAAETATAFENAPPSMRDMQDSAAADTPAREEAAAEIPEAETSATERPTTAREESVFTPAIDANREPPQTNGAPAPENAGEKTAADLEGDLELAEVSIIQNGANENDAAAEVGAVDDGVPEAAMRDAKKPRRLKFLGVPLI
ncbi:MAG: EAL domain-containing protein [Parvularculaceae bacterium]